MKKISRWLSRRNAHVSHNQGKITPSIAPSRACASFESKIFHCLWSLTNHSAWFVTSFCNEITVFCSVKKNALNQSDWKNFLMYIINWKTHQNWFGWLPINSKWRHFINIHVKNWTIIPLHNICGVELYSQKKETGVVGTIKFIFLESWHSYSIYNLLPNIGSFLPCKWSHWRLKWKE